MFAPDVNVGHCFRLTTNTPFALPAFSSSAALISSLTSSILLYYSPKVDVKTLETLSQNAHHTAQGKIGSGFDVSTAIYGSQIYTKKEFGERIVEKVNVKRGKIRLGDVKEGSESVGMSRKVLAGIKNSPGKEVFEELKGKNEESIRGYVEGKEFGDGVRSCLRELGSACDVEIEPVVRRKILNDTQEIEGVEYCCVPGAGGFDAICCVGGGEEVERRWKEEGIEVVEVEEDGGGIRIERL